MAQAAVKAFESAPNVAHVSVVLDRAHLAGMTFGDHSLEREILQLFDRQAELLMDRIRASAPPGIATLAHTLKGSAAGVGAGRVARAAEAAELIATGEPSDCSCVIDQLSQAVDEVRTQIRAMLRTR